MVHEIQVAQYKTVPSSIKLGTFDSYGTEQLHFTFGSGWEDLAVYATFTAPTDKSVQTAVDLDGYTDVPPEATAGEAGQGEIVLIGKAEGVNRITVTLYYTVLEHGPVQGAEPAVPTPDLLQQVLTLSKDAQQSAKNAEQSAKNAVKDATDTVKPYKEEAAQAAAAAALSEKSAAESKVAAQKAAERSAQAGIAAVNAANEAKRSAGIATGAAGNSARNAESAQKSAQNAQQSATDAAESKNAAKASADAAAKSQQSAAIDAKNATDAKVAAAGSADDAADSAAAAGNAASAAEGSKQAAGTSEEQAAASERAAKESEQAAEKSAQAALESKQAAATSEGNAAASAKKAQGVADSLPADYTTAVSEISKLKTDKADKSALETVKQQVESITPDDSSVGEKPWSSKNIIDMLCPPLEESGNPVMCYPVAGYPLGVKAKWEPTQEGSGTPSPENIRPIKGRDSVTVERCGENLLKFPTQSFKFTHYVGPYVVNLKAGIYCVACGNVAHDGKNDPAIAFTDDKEKIMYLFLQRGMKKKFTLERDCTNIYMYANGYDFNGSAGISATIEDLMLVAGTTAPTTYTPYTGQTNTLTLPETVYGGEVDAVSGEGQETWETVTLDGTENWSKMTNVSSPYFKATILHLGTVGLGSLAAKCTEFPLVDINGNNDNNGFNGWGSVLFIRWASFSTVDSLKSYLAAQYAAGTPVQICYKLADPVPFTATGAQPLPALAGLNTVLTDADSVDVTGRADPIKRITDLEDAVASQT